MPDNPFEPMIKNIGYYVSGTLYAQGVIPPIGIDNYEGLALSSPADTHLLAAKDPVINEIAVGMTGNEIKGEYVTGTPPLTLSDSEGYPLQWWQVNLSPYQEGTGDPAPDNVRPIHGTDKVTVWTSGVNLWGGEPMMNDFYTAGNNSIKDETLQTVSFNGRSNTVFSGFPFGINKQYTFIFTLSNTNANTGTNIIFTYTDGAFRYLNKASNTDKQTIVYVSASGKTLSTVSLVNAGGLTTVYCAESGMFMGVQTADVFVPYVPPSQTVITLPSTIYSGHVLAGGAVSNWGEITLTGVESWSNYGSPVHGFYMVLADMSNGTRQSGLTNWLKTDTTGGISGARAIFGAGNHILYCANIIGNIEGVTSIDEWKSYLAGHPLQVVYPLTAPTSVTLSTPSVPTPHGNATTWATAEVGTVDSMEVTYIGKV